jgi:hypothetical protein
VYHQGKEGEGVTMEECYSLAIVQYQHYLLAFADHLSPREAVLNNLKNYVLCQATTPTMLAFFGTLTILFRKDMDDESICFDTYGFPATVVGQETEIVRISNIWPTDDDRSGLPFNSCYTTRRSDVLEPGLVASALDQILDVQRQQWSSQRQSYDIFGI